MLTARMRERYGPLYVSEDQPDAITQSLPRVTEPQPRLLIGRGIWTGDTLPGLTPDICKMKTQPLPVVIPAEKSGRQGEYSEKMLYPSLIFAFAGVIAAWFGLFDVLLACVAICVLWAMFWAMGFILHSFFRR